jgi:hypothetical protein
VTRIAGSAVALLTLAVLVGCSSSPASELARRLRSTSPPDGYQVSVTVSDPSSIVSCFPDGGTLAISVIDDESIAVFDDPMADPVLVAQGDELVLRPSAFARGPDAWWAIKGPAALESVGRLVGPIVAELALTGEAERPNRQLGQLLTTADSVERLDDNRFRIIDRSVEPTVLDVTLDAHDHLEQLVVAGEDPQQQGQRDATQVGYTARYRDGANHDRFGPRPTRRVDAAQLDSLDNRPGACDPVVAP